MITALVIGYLILGSTLAEQPMEVSDTIEKNTFSDQTVSPTEEVGKDIDKIVEDIKHLAALANKYGRDVPKERTEELYEKITEKFKFLVELLKTSNDAYKILNNRDLDQIIKSITSINYDPLKKELLTLLKTLFSVAPLITKELLPPIIIDKLLNIFKKDSNFLQNYALDIMNKWLPNNPRIQARVMQQNGLDFFYDKVTKLDTSLVYNLLALFNNILEEHLAVRSKERKDKNDFETMKLYENIGLIDKISTSASCNGIMNIFSIITTRKEFEFHPIVYQMLKNIKPFCLRSYNGKLHVAKVLEILKSHDNDLSDNNLENMEAKNILDEYIRYIKDGPHDEF